MPHSPEEKKKVLARVRRIRGQCDALERALEAGADCGPVLQQIAAIRGAVNGLMSEVMEAHLREEFGQPAQSEAQRAARVTEMSGLIRSYLKSERESIDPSPSGRRCRRADEGQAKPMRVNHPYSAPPSPPPLFAGRGAR